MATTFHLTPREYWESQRLGPDYTPETFVQDGFIHCTDDESNVVAVGNRYYRNDSRVMVCLEIDIDAVTSEIRYEDAEQIYPHIYGPLALTAICGIRPVLRHADGNFMGLGDSIED